MKNVIFRNICGLLIMAFSMQAGKELCIRKLCLDAERYGHGIITWTDLHGKDHHAIVEPYK